MFYSQEIFTIVLGLVLLVIVTIATQINKKKYQTLTIFQVSSYFYLLIYSLVPIYYILNLNEAPTRIYNAKHSNELFQVTLLAIIGYIVFIGSVAFGNRVYLKRRDTLDKYLPLRKYEYWAIITFFLGMFGLLIEIQLQGGFTNSLKNIELIRSFGIKSSAKDGINNPLVFFRMFKPFLIFSFYVFFMLTRFTNHPRHKFMCLLTFILSTYIVFIGGGRTHIIIFLVTVLAGFMYSVRKEKKDKELSSIKKTILTVAFIFVGIISLIVFDPIFSYLTFGTPIVFSIANLNGIVSQFSFPYSNLIFVLSNDIPFRLFQDLFSWFISLFPSFITSRLGIPEPIPLYEINTTLQLSSMNFGGIPSDILTFGFFQFGYIGTIIIIMIFGYIISRLDKLVVEFKSNNALKPIVLRVVLYIGMIVMYADLEGTFRSRYDVILLIFLLYDIRKYNMPKEKRIKKL